MSVIIRLQNLPWSANAADIRGFFKGLSIPDGGVHIVGGENGDAFIAFSTDEDARQAMALNGGRLKETQVSLLLSSRAEMQKVIEAARQQTISFMSITASAAVEQPATATVATPAAQGQQLSDNMMLDQALSSAQLTASQQQEQQLAKPEPPIITASSLSGILAQQMYQQQAQQQLQLLAQQQQQHQQQQQAQQFVAQQATNTSHNQLQNQLGANAHVGSPSLSLPHTVAASAVAPPAIASNSSNRDDAHTRNSRSRSRSRERRSRRSRSRDRSSRRSHRSSRSRSRERTSRGGGGSSSRRYRHGSRERDRGGRSERNSARSSYDRDSSSSAAELGGSSAAGTPKMGGTPTAIQVPAVPPHVWDKKTAAMRPQQQQQSLEQLQLQQQHQHQKMQQQQQQQHTPQSISGPSMIGPYGIHPIGMNLQGSPLSVSSPLSVTAATASVAAVAGNALLQQQQHLIQQDQQQQQLHHQQMLSNMPTSVIQQPNNAFPPGMFSTLPPNMQAILQHQQAPAIAAFLTSPTTASMTMPIVAPLGVPAPNNTAMSLNQTLHSQPQQLQQPQNNPMATTTSTTSITSVDQRVDVRMRNLDQSVHYSGIRKLFAGLQIPTDGIKMLHDEFGNRRGEALVRFTRPFFAQQAASKSGNIFSMCGQPMLVELIDAGTYDAEVDAFRPAKRSFNGGGDGGSSGGGSMLTSSNQFSLPPPMANAIRGSPAIGTGETDQFGRRIRSEEELARAAAAATSAKLSAANTSIDDSDDVIFTSMTTATPNITQSSSAAQQSCTALLVEDLPWFTSEQDIMRMFSDFTLLHIVLAKEPKNFHAYVRFHNAADAAIALKAKFNHRIGYKQVHVSACSAVVYERARAEYSADFVETIQENIADAQDQQQQPPEQKTQQHQPQQSLNKPEHINEPLTESSGQRYPRSKLFQQTNINQQQQQQSQQPNQNNPNKIQQLEFIQQQQQQQQQLLQQQQQQEQVMLMQQRQAQLQLAMQQQQTIASSNLQHPTTTVQPSATADVLVANPTATPTLNMNFSNFGSGPTSSHQQTASINYSDPRMRKQFQQPAQSFNDTANVGATAMQQQSQSMPFNQPTHVQQQQQASHFMQQQPLSDSYNQQQQQQHHDNNSNQQQDEQTAAFTTRFVFISNMEFRSGEQAIRNWFGAIDVSPLAVHVLLNPRGQSAGEAVCYFRTGADAARAQMLNRTRMRSRTVTVRFMPPEQAAAALRTLGVDMPEDFAVDLDNAGSAASTNDVAVFSTGSSFVLDSVGGPSMEQQHPQRNDDEQQQPEQNTGDITMRNSNNPFGRRFNNDNHSGNDGRPSGSNVGNDFDNINTDDKGDSRNDGDRTMSDGTQQHMLDMQQSGDFEQDNDDNDDVQNPNDDNDDDDDTPYNGPARPMIAGFGGNDGGGGFHNNNRQMNGGGNQRFHNNNGHNNNGSGNCGGGMANNNFRSRGGNRGGSRNDMGGRGMGSIRGNNINNNNNGGGEMQRNTNGCIVAMRNVPFNANAVDIMRFFSNFPLTADDIIRRYRDDGSPTGDARVCFQTPMDARMAIDQYQNGRIMNRVIQMMLLN